MQFLFHTSMWNLDASEIVGITLDLGEHRAFDLSVKYFTSDLDVS